MLSLELMHNVNFFHSTVIFIHFLLNFKQKLLKTTFLRFKIKTRYQRRRKEAVAYLDVDRESLAGGKRWTRISEHILEQYPEITVGDTGNTR